MARVVTNLTGLRSRGGTIASVLKDISKVNTGPAWNHRATTREVIIGMHGGAPGQSDYRAWRFLTFVPGIHAMYFELWRLSGGEEAFLDRAYLSLFRIARFEGEKELLALHCDPNEADSAPHVMYKRGPHLHLLASTFPSPHAHIPLNRCHLDQVLQSVETFTDAFHKGVIMIKDEVLEPLSHEPITY